MTLLLVFENIENGKLSYDEELTVSENASNMGGSQIFLKPGEKMKVDDLIKSVIVASANDAAVTLAEHVAGTIEAFVQMMNEKAEILGMKNTHFENATGLDDTASNHLTSAYDIAIMSRELIKFKKVSEYATIWMDTIRNGEFGLTNTNRLVRYYKGITGLKTGYTSKSGYCISATAKRDSLELIAVVMGAETSNERNNCVSKLLDFGFANYKAYNVPGDEISNIKIEYGTQNFVKVKYDDVSFIENFGNNEIKKEINIQNNIKAPVKEGDVLGTVSYKINDKIVATRNIYSLEKVDEISFWGFFCKVIKNFI
jgi:D-alanyl-D-alanine carboxypeptidase (penicillin-binding protein 5/6)